MEEPARHASGYAPGQMELVGKWGETWSVEEEAHCSSTCLEEEVVPTKVAVVFFFSGAYIGRSIGKMD